MANSKKNTGSIAAQKKTVAEVTEKELQKQLQEKIRKREEEGLKDLLSFLEEKGLELHITPEITINGQSPSIMVKAMQ